MELLQPAQPAFTASIAEEPAHPAKRAGDGAIFVAGEKRHPRRKPESNYMTDKSLRKDVATNKPL
jgi:hypothetical protein